MVKKLLLAAGIFALCGNTGCEPVQNTDKEQTKAQTKALAEANAEVGMPAIINWQEKRMAKDIYEMRDSAISTYSYLFNEMQGCFVFLGNSVGYGLPYATQYSNPEKVMLHRIDFFATMPQAEPNGLFMPAQADGTWVMLKDPASTKVTPVYVEPRVIVSQFRLPSECK